jgi:hypothetical protein
MRVQFTILKESDKTFDSEINKIQKEEIKSKKTDSVLFEEEIKSKIE